MKPYIRNSLLGLGLAASVGVAGVAADILVTAGSGTTIFTFTCQTTKLCPAAVTIRNDGTEIFTAGAPAQVSLANTGANATAVLVTGTGGTFPVSGSVTATLSAETAKVIGTVRNLGNLGGVIDFAGQNATSPPNSWLTGGQFNNTPTAITSGNSSPLQLDANGNLKVNIIAGAGSGGTASTFGAAFPTTGTAAGMSQAGSMVALTGTGGNLNINCQVGCTAGAGTFNNNSDNVAPTATNGTVAAWNYVWDGAGGNWDRLPGDSTNGAKVAATIAAGADVTTGNTTDTATTAGAAGTVSAKLRLMTSQLDAINTNVQSGAGGTGTAVPGAGIYVGCRAQNAEAIAVTNGQLVGQACDLVGKQIVLPYANPENFVSGGTAAMTATTSTSVIAAGGAGVRNYITACTFSNATAATGTMILLQDGSGGTTLWQAPAAGAFGGAHVVFPTPIKTTAATALFAANAAAPGTGGTFVYCTGYRGI